MFALTPNPPSSSPLKLRRESSPRTNPRLNPLHATDGTQPDLPTSQPTSFHTERGLNFEVGDAFFRHESFTGRDLGVLAAALYKQRKPQLRVVDAMCGCGIRSLRYLAESGADFVIANDANDGCRRTVVSNLSQIHRFSGGKRRWVVVHFDANRVLTELYLQKDFFDLIDLDCFGSDSSFLRSALCALKLDGLVYVTSTDGYSSGGHRPHTSLASYGAYVRPMPFSNEVGLRMLIGGAVREALILGYYVTPLFSYYSYHGPVFRVMLKMNHGKVTNTRHYGFISYCFKCGNSHVFSWDQLGEISCPCTNEIGSLVVSGPLWTGPLHDAAYLTEMLNLAEEWRWIGNDGGSDLEKLLKQMIEESDPKLPPGFFKSCEVGRRGKVNSPPLSTMMNTLKKEGYAVSRSHIDPNAIKTNCPMTACIRIAKNIQGC